MALRGCTPALCFFVTRSTVTFFIGHGFSGKGPGFAAEPRAKQAIVKASKALCRFILRTGAIAPLRL